MCNACAEKAASDGQTRILHLLALIEEPDALPAGLALRLGQEIWALTRTSTMACEAVPAPEAAAHE